MKIGKRTDEKLKIIKSGKYGNMKNMKIWKTEICGNQKTLTF